MGHFFGTTPTTTSIHTPSAPLPSPSSSRFAPPPVPHPLVAQTPPAGILTTPGTLTPTTPGVTTFGEVLE